MINLRRLPNVPKFGYRYLDQSILIDTNGNQTPDFPEVQSRNLEKIYDLVKDSLIHLGCITGQTPDKTKLELKDILIPRSIFSTTNRDFNTVSRRGYKIDLLDFINFVLVTEGVVSSASYNPSFSSALYKRLHLPVNKLTVVKKTRGTRNNVLAAITNFLSPREEISFIDIIEILSSQGNACGAVADAVNDTFTTSPGVQVAGIVGTNDMSCRTGTTTYGLVSGSENNGTVDSFDTNTGAFTFTPTTGFNGDDASFQYTISCDNVLADTATAIISVDPYVAVTVEDSFTTDPNTQVSGNVSLNDTPCDFGVTSYDVELGTVVNGTVSMQTDGNFTFDPTPNLGNDIGSFTVRLLCDNEEVDTSVVDITINPYTAIAVNDSFTGNINTVLTGNVATNDTSCNLGTTDYQLISSTSSGVMTSFTTTTGAFQYTPNTGFTGLDSFTYAIRCDGNQIGTATATIAISSFTATAVDDTDTTDPETATSGDISTNDTPCSSGVTTYEEVPGNTINGTVTLNTDGTYTFTPTAGVGDSIGTFQAQLSCDGIPTDTSFNIITINPYTATATAKSRDVRVGETLLADFSSGDTACNFGTTTYSIITPPSSGTINTFDPNTGLFSYTPSSNFADQDVILYAINCGGTQIATALFTINILTNLSPNFTSVTAPATIDGTGSTGNYITFGIDLDTTGTVNEKLAYIDNRTDPQTFSANLVTNTISDGDTVYVYVADDAAGTNEAIATWLVPNTIGSFVGTPDTLSSIRLDLTAVFDSNTTNRNFLIEVLDSSNAVVYTRTLTGTVSQYTNYLLNLTAQGITDVVAIRVTASDEKDSEITPLLLDRCALLPAVDFNTIIQGVTVTDNGDGTETWLWNSTIDDTPPVSVTINSVTLGSTAVDFTETNANFARVEIIDTDGTTIVADSGYQAI